MIDNRATFWGGFIGDLWLYCALPVDVGTIDGLKPRVREHVLAESIYVN